MAIWKGAFDELMATAKRNRSVTFEEIAEVTDTKELLVGAELYWKFIYDIII